MKYSPGVEYQSPPHAILGLAYLVNRKPRRGGDHSSRSCRTTHHAQPYAVACQSVQIAPPFAAKPQVCLCIITASSDHETLDTY